MNPAKLVHLNLSFSLSLLFMGFLLANILGILTNSKITIFLFVLGIELISYFTYSNKFNLLLSSLMSKGSSTQGIERPRFSFPTLTLKASNRTKLPLIEASTTLANMQRRTNKIFHVFYWLHFLITPNKKQKELINIDNQTKYKASIFVLTIISSLNFLKIGFEFGFFIDAFKLGS